MSVDTQYKRAHADAGVAFKNYIIEVQLLHEGRATEQGVNGALNNLITLCWRLKEAAMEKEPAPLPRKSVKPRKGENDAA